MMAHGMPRPIGLVPMAARGGSSKPMAMNSTMPPSGPITLSDPYRAQVILTPISTNRRTRVGIDKAGASNTPALIRAG